MMTNYDMVLCVLWIQFGDIVGGRFCKIQSSWKKLWDRDDLVHHGSSDVQKTTWDHAIHIELI